MSISFLSMQHTLHNIDEDTIFEGSVLDICIQADIVHNNSKTIQLINSLNNGLIDLTQ